MTETDFDLLVIGSGPAGQKAAIQAAKAGRRVALVESDRRMGGACVHRGTIPSKTLRESALRILSLRRNSELIVGELRTGREMATLVRDLGSVVTAHHAFISAQLARNAVTCLHGRAAFLEPDTVQVEALRGDKKIHRAERVIIATGSYPRKASAVTTRPARGGGSSKDVTAPLSLPFSATSTWFMTTPLWCQRTATR